MPLNTRQLTPNWTKKLRPSLQAAPGRLTERTSKKLRQRVFLKLPVPPPAMIPSFSIKLKLHLRESLQLTRTLHAKS